MVKSGHPRSPKNLIGMIVSSLLRALLLATLLTAGAAGAVGLGEINLHSRTGEPLRAELPIQASGEALDIGCISLAPVPGADFPVITTARLRLLRLGQDYRLVITGRQPISEPIVVASIRIGCGFELQREYVLLPAPPLTSGSEEDAYDSPEPAPPRRKARPVAEASPNDDIDAQTRPPRKPRVARNAQQDNALSPSPLAKLSTGRDRVILGSAPDHLPPRQGSDPMAPFNEMDERLLKMETTLHLLNAEVDKLSSAAALGVESRAARQRLQELQALQPSAGLPRPPPLPAPTRQSHTLDGWIELLIGILIGGAVSATVAHVVSRRSGHDRQFTEAAPKIAKPRHATR